MAQSVQSCCSRLWSHTHSGDIDDLPSQTIAFALLDSCSCMMFIGFIN